VYSRRLLPEERCAICGRTLIPDRSTVSYGYSERTGRAGIRGVMQCGDVWRCPTCSLREMLKRRERLAAAEQRARSLGMGLALVTLTLRHSPGDSLSGLIDALKGAWHKTRSGRAWIRARERFGVLAVVTALEIRHGWSGWSPHLHAILATSRPLTDAELEELREWLSERFGRYVAAVGEYTSPTWGVDVAGHAGVAGYLAKWNCAEEMTMHHVKRSKGQSVTPWVLLDRAGRGDALARSLWLEYAEATRGRHQMDGLGALLELVGLDDEQSDAESDADAETVESEPSDWVELVSLTREQHEAVIRAGADAEACSIIEATRSAGALWTYLTEVVGIPTTGVSHA